VEKLVLFAERSSGEVKQNTAFQISAFRKVQLPPPAPTSHCHNYVNHLRPQSLTPLQIINLLGLT